MNGVVVLNVAYCQEWWWVYRTLQFPRVIAVVYVLLNSVATELR